MEAPGSGYYITREGDIDYQVVLKVRLRSIRKFSSKMNKRDNNSVFIVNEETMQSHVYQSSTRRVQKLFRDDKIMSQTLVYLRSDGENLLYYCFEERVENA